MKIAIDCDDAALELKEVIYKHIQSKGIEIEDLLKTRPNSAMYPEIAFNLATKIKEKKYERGILFCGTGLGMAMVANKVEGVFAGTCHDTYSAERLRKSNDAQIITMGARVVGSELAKTIIDAWLRAEFAGGGSTPKVEQMHKLEKRSFHP
jgi:ribose 5-phosphate isomerase B